MDLSAQLPFLLQAVPTASLVFPPLGTARRYLQFLQRHTEWTWEKRVFTVPVGAPLPPIGPSRNGATTGVALAPPIELILMFEVSFPPGFDSEV